MVKLYVQDFPNTQNKHHDLFVYKYLGGGFQVPNKYFLDINENYADSNENYRVLANIYKHDLPKLETRLDSINKLIEDDNDLMFTNITKDVFYSLVSERDCFRDCTTQNLARSFSYIWVKIHIFWGGVNSDRDFSIMVNAYDF